MENDTTKKQKTKSRKHQILKIIRNIALGILAIFILLILFIRSPWGQGIIIDFATSYISNKTHTKVELDKLFITFGGDIKLKGLYLEDTKGDTLIYSKSLKADLPLLPIITGKGVGLEALNWEGFRANITRKDALQGFNFQFIIDALAPEDTKEPVETSSESAPLKLIIGNINLKDFNVVYNDAVLGIDSQIELGTLELDMEEFDLEAMRFTVSEASISNSEIKYIQAPVPPSTDTTSTTLPYLYIKDFKINKVKAHYKSLADALTFNTSIAEFYIEDTEIDLPNSIYKIDDIGLENSEFSVLMTEDPNRATVQSQEVDTPMAWPAMMVKIKNINLKNNKIHYTLNGAAPKPDIFNANAIVLEHFNLNAEDLFLKDKTAGINLKELTAKEASGLDLKTGTLKLTATDKNLSIDNLKLWVNNTKIEGYSSLEYSSLAKVMNAPKTSKLAVKIPVLQIDIKDAYRFQPDLKTNVYVDSLSQHLITGHLNAQGTLSAINLQSAAVQWGNNTKIEVLGQINNATATDSLYLNISPFRAVSQKQDLLKFVNETELGINLPNTVNLSGSLKGTLKDIQTEAILQTSQGNATLVATYKDAKGIQFTSDLQLEAYKLNELLLNDQLGPLSLTLKASGAGKTVNDLDAKVEALISGFRFNNYDIQNLPIQGELVKGEGNISSNYKDKNINLELNSHVILDSIFPEFTADLNLIGVDLQALGIIQKDLRAGLKLHADFKGNADQFDLSSSIKEGTIVYNNSTYLLGDVTTKAHITKDTTYVILSNNLLNLELASNTNPQTFSKALSDHISGYFIKDTLVTENSKPVNLKLTGNLNQGPLFKDVFLPSLKNLDTVNIALDFHQENKILQANITAPHINYSDYILDSLAFTIDTNPERFNLDFGFKKITAGPLLIKRTHITGHQFNDNMAIEFVAYDDEDILSQIQSKVTVNNNQLNIHILPETLILNKTNWQIPEDNSALYTDKSLTFTNFKFKNASQTFAITNGTDSDTDNITLAFNAFKLSELLSYFNPNEGLAEGTLNGKFTIKTPFYAPGFLADLNLTDLNVLNTNFGTLTLEATTPTKNTYNFNLSSKQGDIDLDFNGEYSASETHSNLNADLTINTFKIKALEGLSLGELSNASGDFNGKFKITGSTDAPVYNGNITFNDAKFKVNKLNTDFALAKETINIDNSGISFSNFTITDTNKSALVVDGLIGTKNFSNPTFDLKIKATDFQVLNATREDNDMIFGFLAFNAEGSIQGDLNVPVVKINADVNPKTDISYVLPSAAVSMESRDGVVIFVNRDNPDAILTRNQEETATVTGFDVQAKFSISKEAKVTLILDENTNDNFQTSGEGDFVFSMDTNGRMSLTGIYTVSSGHYEMSLYELVNRKFELVPGSRVSWSGNPFDANLDVKALYKIKASASPLMASQISGSDPSVKNKYKQVLPFEVYLNIDGELMHPKIAFNLDMPEEDQGAIGGQVYGRVQQVNLQEGELNRQVFSLLVMGRFYPESGSDGSDGGFASIARDNLNDAVSDQLNMFSDKLLGNTGFELDFGLNSFTDYQGDSPQQRTQLDVAAQKKLFNDRLIVRVGSEVDIEGSASSERDTPIIGDVSLEYLLTPSGKYRLKAFQKNEFETVIDGQTIVSGIALIFTQEFNQFKELWTAMFHSDMTNAGEKSDKIPEKKNTN